MKKIKNSLSNNVYRDGDRIKKEYIIDSFKQAYGNQEDEGLIIAEIPFDLKGNSIEMDYIEHEPWNNYVELEENIKFIKWLRSEHDKQEVSNYSEFPGFYKAYLNILNPPQGKFRKVMKWWPHEEGFFKDAMKFLQEGKRVFLHNDLVEGNILVIPNGYKLIDWEYAGVGNVLFDVASFVTERDISHEDAEKIVLAYDKNTNLDDFWIIAGFLQAFWSRWAWYKYISTQEEIYKTIYDWKIDAYNKIINSQN